MGAEFKLQIDLGNDAMTSADDVARALERIARQLRAGQARGVVRDVNGNVVGAYALVPGKGMIG